MNIKKLKDILPKEPTLLMGAGPVPIPNEVKEANGVVISHLGESMNLVVDEIRRMGSYLLQTKSDKILGIAGPASASMEMAICNLITKNTSVLVLKMGLFSGRFEEMALKVGGNVKVINSFGNIITPNEVEFFLKNGSFEY